jgi:hypothetical protein
MHRMVYKISAKGKRRMGRNPMPKASAGWGRNPMPFIFAS